MTWYEFFLFVHITAAVIWLGGAFTFQMYGFVVRRGGDPGEIALFAGRAGHLSERMFVPAALTVVVAGIALMINGNWDWSEWFVALGLVGWAVVSFTAFGYLSRSLSRVGMRMATEGPSPELGAEMNRLILLARTLILILFLVVFVMVVKPGT